MSKELNKSTELPLWQTHEWQHFQEELGFKCLRISSLKSRPLLIILPLFKKWNYAYIPRGPVIQSEEEQKIFVAEINKIAKENQLVFTKIDPIKALKKEKNFCESHSPQPETTLILDLDLSEKELLKQMKRKGRYNIQLAEKKGVEIFFPETQQQKQEAIKQFYSLLQSTTERDGFSGHKQQYYQKMIESIPYAKVITAHYQNEVIAAGIFTFQKQRSIYYYGASSNQHRNVMAPYLLQWEAIKYAKKNNSKHYDFLGIAPEGSSSKHPWHGITSFKKKFGGIIETTPPAYDIVHKNILYKLYKLYKYLTK